jgi:membrane-associated protease RseP (regulator of RpoE activity)
MKNLKKALALVLAIALCFSLVTVAGAATNYDDYADASTVTEANAEAVDVVTGLGIIEGKENNKLDLSGNLTRAEASKILAVLNLGADLAASVNSSTVDTGFSDTKGNWACGYIAYCASQNYLTGSNGKFDPNGQLTGYAFGKMLLNVLGYGLSTKTIEGTTTTINKYEGTQWAINVAVDGNKIGLFAGVDTNLSNAITRADAMQMVFNALKVNAKASSKNGAWYALSSEFAITEKTTGLTSDLGADAHKWQVTVNLKTTDVTGNYVDTPAVTYTTPVTAAQLYTDLNLDEAASTSSNKFTVDKENIVVNTNAEQDNADADLDIKKGDKDTVIGGYGVVTEVYTKANGDISKIISVEPAFDTVTVASKSASKTVGAYTTYTTGASATLVSGVVYTSHVDAEKELDSAVVTGTIKDGDKVLSYNGDETAYFEAVSTISGVVTAKNVTKGTVTIGGKEIYVAAAGNIATFTVKKDVEVTAYVDSYGYLLEAVEVVPETVYALVLSSDSVKTLDGNKIVEKYTATLAYTDGTVETVDSVLTTGKSAEYNTLTEDLVGLLVTVETGVKGAVLTQDKAHTLESGITKGEAELTEDTLYANANTKFIYANFELNDDGKKMVPTGTVNIITGIANIISKESTVKLYALDTDAKPDGIADVVFVYDDAIPEGVTSFVYLIGSYTQTTDGYVYDVIKDGKEDTITLSHEIASLATAKKTLYSSITDGTDSVKLTAASEGTSFDSIQNKGGLLFLSGSYNDDYKIATTAPVYIIDSYDDSVEVKTFADITTEIGETSSVFVAVAEGEITAVYVMTDSTPDAE